MKAKGNYTKALNPKKQPLTVEVFKKLTNNDTMSDEEAEQAVVAIRTLVGIIMEYDIEHTIINQKQAA